MEQTKFVRVYRIIVACIVAFYFFEPLITDPPNFIYRSKFLTLWGLYGSFLVAMLMLARSLNLTTKRFDGFVAMVIVLNILVVFLYWRLYFQDPALVNADGPIVWWREYYIHLMCEVFMWIDAFFFFGAWQKIKSGLLWLAAIICSYIALIELYIQPRNTFPEGSVTAGLPYPFLNNMELSERLGFYGTTAATGLVMAAVTIAIAWVLRRFFGRSHLA